jgi:hypothetical protein
MLLHLSKSKDKHRNRTLRTSEYGTLVKDVPCLLILESFGSDLRRRCNVR